MTVAERSDNLRIPLEVEGMEICLRFLSKGYYIRSCTRSYAPVQGQNREAVICYIRIDREVMDP